MSHSDDVDDSVTDISFEEVPLDSKYVSLQWMHFTRLGKRVRWEIAAGMDFVAILIFNLDQNSFVFVRQFRPPVFRRLFIRNRMTSHPNPAAEGPPAPVQHDPSRPEEVDPIFAELSDTYSYELCAGLCDKPGASLRVTAVEELEEECGYHVSVDDLMFIGRSLDVGLSGRMGTLFYVEVSDAQKKSEGGGLIEEGEKLDIIMLPADELESFVTDHEKLKTGTLEQACWWWMCQNGKGKVPMTEKM